jgi:CRISPR-associated endonuclease/helicase Cas3
MVLARFLGSCLVERIESQGRWPLGLAVPTGCGKTSAIDIAVFCLARDLSRGQGRRMMPTRIAFVVDRRIIVDAAYDRARFLSHKTQIGENPIVAAVRDALATVAASGFAVLHVERLRGGVPRERDWTPSPAHATVLLSTVDQVGSRLLFRGYGVSESMRPVHAGLLGTDALVLLDEVHLSEPFRQTLRAIERMRGDAVLPWATVELSATPRTAEDDILRLNDEDRDHPVLRERLKACKPADIFDAPDDMESFAERFVQEAIARSTLGEGDHARILVIVNRVALARLIYEKLRLRISDGAIPVTLLIGRSRDIDSDALRKSILERTGNRANEPLVPVHQPYFLVATQTIEAGADVDFDVLITQAAPLDTLRQRFGRLDRSGFLAKG